MSQTQLINIEQVAEKLGVKITTVYSWVNQRKLPYFKIGRLLKFDVRRIEEWITEQERPVEDSQLIPLRFKGKPYKYTDMKSRAVLKGSEQRVS